MKSQPIKTMTKAHAEFGHAARPIAKALSGKQIAEAWIEEVKSWQEEISFLSMLMSLGLDNLPCRHHREANALKAEFETYQSCIIPAFINSLEELSQRSELEPEIHPAIMAKLQKHRTQIRSLKKRLFPFLSYLVPCKIW